MKTNKKLMIILGVALIAGSINATWMENVDAESGLTQWVGKEDRMRFVYLCKKSAENKDFELGPYNSNEQHFKKDYCIVHLDDKYLSYRCEEFTDLGGAHGCEYVYIGTIDRSTGKELKVTDVFPKSDHEVLRKMLREKAALAIGGEKNFLNEPDIPENFCLMKDGWHFVYNVYEIAPFAAGTIEVVIEKDYKEFREINERWNARAVELRKKFEEDGKAVSKKMKQYELNTIGDMQRVSDYWYYILKSYREISDEYVKIRGKDGVEIRNKLAHWIAAKIEEAEEARRKEEDGGSYAGIFALGNKTDLYERVINLLLLNSFDMAKWMRVESAVGEITGVPIAFTNGDAKVVLSWRIFDPKEKKKDFDFASYIEPQNVVSVGDKDYAIVRFPAKGNMEGCPTTTEERMLFEIKNGRITRMVGLHNFHLHKIKIMDNGNVLWITGEDGFSQPEEFFVVLNEMKIDESRSTISEEFHKDGYDQFLRSELSE